MKKIITLCFATLTLFTGCANLGGGNDLLGTLSGLGQFADRLYTGYQAGVAAGHLPPSAEVSDKYAQYLFMFNLASSWLKPSAPPPAELVKAKTELVKAIDDATADAAKAKKAKTTVRNTFIVVTNQLVTSTAPTP